MSLLPEEDRHDLPGCGLREPIAGPVGRRDRLCASRAGALQHRYVKAWGPRGKHGARLRNVVEVVVKWLALSVSRVGTSS